MLVQQTINKANVGFKTIFNKVFEETETSFEKIATVVPSNNKIESYHWLGSMPTLRKWIGDKVVKNIQEHEYTIKNEPFEATISISKFDIQDDNLGIYKPQVESLAQSAKLHPEQLVFETLEKGFTEKCYDGVAFFGTHKVGKKTYKNFTDKKLTLENYISARKTMMGLKNEEGKSLRIMPDLLVVPPSLEKEAMDIVKADFINGSSNTYKGTAEILVSTELISETGWYLLDTKKAIKPFIYQERQKPKFLSLTNDTDETVFLKGDYLYSVEARGNAGYGFWQMAYGSTGTA